MSVTHPRSRTSRLARATTTVLAATSLAAGSILAGATEAAAAAPIAACVFTDSSHVSVSLNGDLGLLGLANLATVTLTDSSNPGTILGTYTNVSLLGGLINISPSGLPLPSTSTGVNYSIQPIGILGGLLTPIVGNTPCAALPVQPVTGSYEVLRPTRILDTRSGFGGLRIAAKSTLTLAVAGHAGVPAMSGLLGLPGTGPSAVNLNFTATNAGAPGFLTVYPAGQPRPNVSNLNFAPGKDIANTAIAHLSSTGQISIYNDSLQPVDLVGDVSGYYITGLVTPLLPLLPGAYQPLTPSRLLDTRTAGTAGKLRPLNSLSLAVAGLGGVPSVGAGSVVLNVTATNPTAKGHLRVYPSRTPVPFASNVNFDPGKTVANVVVVAPGTDGQVSIFNGSPNGTTDVIVDVVGYIAGGILPAQTPGLQNAVTPFRLLDTRFAIGGPTGKVPAGGTRTVHVANRDGVPSTDARAAVVTATATNESVVGFATVYPGPTRPTASILNFVKTTDVANVLIAPINASGDIIIYNGSTGPTDLVVDISAYITGSTVSLG